MAAPVDFTRLGAGAVSPSPDGRQAIIRATHAGTRPTLPDPTQLPGSSVVSAGSLLHVEDASSDRPQDDSGLYAIVGDAVSGTYQVLLDVEQDTPRACAPR